MRFWASRRQSAIVIFPDTFEGFKVSRAIRTDTMTECVECGADVALHDDLEVGEIIDCATCGAELEVVDVNPPVLERAPELDEDWGE